MIPRIQFPWFQGSVTVTFTDVRHRNSWNSWWRADGQTGWGKPPSNIFQPPWLARSMFRSMFRSRFSWIVVYGIVPTWPAWRGAGRVCPYAWNIGGYHHWRFSPQHHGSFRNILGPENLTVTQDFVQRASEIQEMAMNQTPGTLLLKPKQLL